MPKKIFQRNEMKFILNKAQVNALISKMTEYMNPDKYCKDGKNYSIYNIYYDNEDNSIIRASLSQPYYKEKLRLRSYFSPTELDGEVYLELKKKIGGIVSKRRAVMTLQEAYDFLETGNRPKPSGYINKQVINEIEYFLSHNHVKPAVFLCYKRMAYYGINDNDFRITFDWGIKTRRNDICLEKGCYGAKLLDDGQYIMEVKIPGAVPKWLADTLAELKIYKTSFSKYGTEYTNYFGSPVQTHHEKSFEPGLFTYKPKLYFNQCIKGVN